MDRRLTFARSFAVSTGVQIWMYFAYYAIIEKSSCKIKGESGKSHRAYDEKEKNDCIFGLDRVYWGKCKGETKCEEGMPCRHWTGLEKTG